MNFLKAVPIACAWLAFAATLGLGVLTAHAQDQPDAAAPAAVEAAPAAAEAPAADPAASEAPAAEAAAAPEAPAPAAQSSTSLTASALRVGTAVFGADGAQIGEINRVTAESSGAVKEIYVTTGGKAGLNAEAVIVPADKITEAGDGVKLSLSAAEVKSLPVADNGNG
jgi:hypothetical protein